MNSRARNIAFAILTIGVSVLICFLFLEFVATYFLYSDTQASVDKRFDPVLGWRYAPGTYRMKPDNSFATHTIDINEYGLRGEYRPWSADKIRVLVLGDSFTFARQVPQTEIFTSRLESLLNEGTEPRFQVMNAGVEGYGSAQELLLLKELRSEGITADVYVLQMFTNDILDNLRLDYESLATNELRPGYRLNTDGNLYLDHAPDRRQWRQGEEPKGTPLRTFRMLAGAAESFVQSRPRIVRFAQQFGVSVPLPRMPGIISGWYDDSVLTDGIPLTSRLIHEIQLEVARQHAQLLVLSIPSPLMVYLDTYRPLLENSFPNDPKVNAFLAEPGRSARVIQSICGQLHVSILDVYPILLGNNAGELYFPRDGHLTSSGHELVADTLAKAIAAAVAPPLLSDKWQTVEAEVTARGTAGAARPGE